MHPRLMFALSIIEALAILAYAISGFIEARKRRLDPVGAFLVAFATAFGGGTVRDVLLERRPFFWVEHQGYVIVLFALSFFAPFVLRMASRVFSERALLVADAIGLGLFSISGTSIALEAGMPWFIAAMMGVVTGVFGVIIRDVLCNEVPLILRDSRPYATCAFAGCWL
ncbi:MAG TPA: trimeric intracellular cation channel family protein, partial [Trinickia sp.]|nr:trimeric intracellular cation channel family protein [Trinickia sp.]